MKKLADLVHWWKNRQNFSTENKMERIDLMV
jgi:hypothetical protein